MNDPLGEGEGFEPPFFRLRADCLTNWPPLLGGSDGT